MVEFVYGRPGSGKTEYIMSRIGADVRAGRRALLIVPEQETVDTESRIAASLPPSAQLTVEALNFSRLANRVFRERGGLIYNYADQSRKLLFMWRALRECSPFLKEYGGRAARDPALPAAMLGTIKELHAGGITADMLRTASQRLAVSGRAGDAAAAGRLYDISVIYSAYAALLGREYSDSDDDLSRLAESVSREPYFCGMSVYIDSFSSFTGQEHNIIKLIMRQADEVVITIPIASPRDRSIYALSSSESSKRLRRDASAMGIDPALISLGDNRRAKNSELLAISRQFAGERTTAEIPEEERGHVELYSAADPYSECDMAAARIKELLMEGARCRDIVIIARDAEKYRGVIDTSLEKLGLPYFISEKTGFSTRPLARLILSALRIHALGWRREDVVAHIKTGLLGISPRDADLFESYAEKWNIHGRAFWSDEPWNMNPDGFADRRTARGEEILARANAVREWLRDRLVPLFAAIEAAESTREVCRAIWQYIEDAKIPETLAAIAERERREGRRREADVTERLIDSAIDALECICDVFDGSAVNEESTTAATAPDTAEDSGKEHDSSTAHTIRTKQKPDIQTLAAALRLAFDAAEIGSIPSGCDEIMIGSANMLRAGERRCALLLGLVEGEFPATPRSGSLLSERDREVLSDLDMPISSGRDTQVSDEMFYLLRAVSTPTERLCLFTHETDAVGSSCRPSSAFLRTAALFDYIKPKRESDISTSDRIWSHRTALEYLPFCLGSPLSGAIRLCFAGDGDFEAEQKKILTPLGAVHESIPAAQAREVFSERMELSQSKIEAFVSCPYSYYLKNILRLDDGERVEFNAAGMGTFIHHVLEKYLLNASKNGGFDAPPDPQSSRELLDDITKSYLALFGESALTPHIKHTVSRLGRIAELLIADIFDEFAGGSFRPEAFEVKIGGKDPRAVPSPEFKLPDGARVVLNGKADRVDSATTPDGRRLIRVVDYKTGERKFSLADARRGLDLQLLIYLYALTDKSSARADGYRNVGGNTAAMLCGQPAAVTYLSSNIRMQALDRPMSGDKAESMARDKINRSGLVVNEEDVLDAISRTRDPHYMQGAKFKSDGTPSDALIDRDALTAVFAELEGTISDIACRMRSGMAYALPVAIDSDSDRHPCNYCKFFAVCRSKHRA